MPLRPSYSWLFLAWASIVLMGCQKSPDLRSGAFPHANMRLPLPTKDEVALVNGNPLSIQDCLNIKSILSAPTPTKTVWVGIATAALYYDSLQKRGATQDQALNIVRYSIEDLPLKEAEQSLGLLYPGSLTRLSPGQVKKDLESLLSRSVIVKNPVDPSSFM